MLTLGLAPVAGIMRGQAFYKACISPRAMWLSIMRLQRAECSCAQGHALCAGAKRLAAKGAQVGEAAATSAESLRAAFDGAYGVWGMTPVVATSAAGARSPYEQEIELGTGPRTPCSQSQTAHLLSPHHAEPAAVCDGFPSHLMTAGKHQLVGAATASPYSKAIRVALSQPRLGL